MPNKSNIPPLYGTEDIPTADKIIYQKWIHPFAPGCYWLVAEFDPQTGIAFGFACLADPGNAEWGYISIAELVENSVTIEKEFKPCRFSDITEQIQ